MKKLIVIMLLTAGLFTACDSVKPGAGKITEGKISYKIDMAGTEMNFLQKQLFEAAKLTISFKGPFTKTDFDMGMVGTTVIADGSTDTGLMLFNMMGNKTAAKMTAEDFEEKKKLKGSYTVENTDETKEIAGYKCKKAIVKLGNGGNLTMYFTEDIMPENRNTSFTYEETKGFPLEMQVNMNGMVFNMVASSVDGSPLSDDSFSMEIPEGYTESDMSQFSAPLEADAN